MDRGDLLLAPFPYSDLRGLKRRPVCVVSSAAYNQGPDVIVAMVTSSRTRVSRPGLGDVVVHDWQAAGLRQASVVRGGRLLVIEHRLLRASSSDRDDWATPPPGTSPPGAVRVTAGRPH